MSKKKKFFYFLTVAMILAFSFMSFAAVAKNEGGSKGKEKSSKSQAKDKSKSAEFKNYQKPDVAKGQTNAQIHKEKTQKVADDLEQAATKEKKAGNTEVSEEIEDVVEQQEEVQDGTTDAIEAVESRGKIKSFLIGTDYKNLGQLRSSLVHNRNEIRKLTKALTQTQTTEEGEVLIQAQLTTLMQERERIKTVITDNESAFSLFGWVARFLTDYEQTPIDEQEEDDLVAEVEEAVDTSDIATPQTVPAQ